MDLAESVKLHLESHGETAGTVIDRHDIVSVRFMEDATLLIL
ncbi:hypothetical protein J2Y45_006719 [Dyadobacter sp. BE34]|uniref:Uncharacterized protein n=1 Tax=Dyadobacter fermentans TaxID=94254 RepID=A0ABU1R8C0_9BACT|nr:MULTISPECIES: hypothetical protein [Dyadobacter]MDR6809641.1 hypothetical protein [Dyadobacter fermentans]MDR7047319.1 hypothetical protein [Dyadobacter sp. BE242]MDR7201555.1 hypothetical protein [Dyadobacter sp. BE34]MDR7219425.1 hypothetical protein [Dyadobacter sp. BE31]MDR7267181.1 hypothetical protein [Dyadobacter sp. BE32]